MTSDAYPILVVYNPAAKGGSSKQVWEKYVQYLETQKLKYVCYITQGDGRELGIDEYREMYHCRVVSVIGGDGTINLVINALSDKSIPLHIIPAGSGNDLAKMIYPNRIPSLEKLFAQVTKTQLDTRPLDIWRCNDRLFANGFGCGFDGSIAYNAKYKQGWLSSKMKYWAEIVKHIFFYTSPSISVNGKTLRTFMLSVANGSTYGGDFKVAPFADISDGKLEVVGINKVWVPLRLYYLPLLILGKHLRKKITTYEQLDKVTISAQKLLPAHLDGEPMLEKEYVISLEGSMEVLV